MKIDMKETIKILTRLVAESCNWRVVWFATQMQATLTHNQHMGKSGWENMTDKQILHRIRQETAELAKAVENNSSREDKIKEAVDIANFALFFAMRYKEEE